MSRVIGVSELIISWRFAPGSETAVTYYVNERAVGVGDVGFEKILEQLKRGEVTKVVVKLTAASSLDSASLESCLAFYERIDEFNGALDGKLLVYKFV